MTKKVYPFCSVIVLNYFGEKVIAQTLNSLLDLNYPKDRYEIIIVDNNSLDQSRTILEDYASKFKNIKVIFMNKNLGFSKGNNVGIKASKGDYVALINNDCIASPQWLNELVETAMKYPKTFAINSKVLLYPNYLNLNFHIDPKLVPLYSQLSDSSLYKFNSKKIYLKLIKTNAEHQIEIPFDSVNDSSVEILFLFNIKGEIKTSEINNLIKFHQKGAEVTLCERKDKDLKVKIRFNLKNNSLTNHIQTKIQNAGIMPFQDGYCRDIGAIVRDSTQYYEYDEGQYDKESEIYAACGAAILLKRDILNKIGLLEESFFMYYEDVELSERARLHGYKIYYSPKAVVRHIHAFSSVENGNFFLFNVEKGRLLHVLYNFPLKVFIQQFNKVIARIIYGFGNLLFNIRHLKVISRKNSVERAEFSKKIGLLNVIVFIITYSPWLLLIRYKKNMSIKKDAVNENFAEILSGRWYFE